MHNLIFNSFMAVVKLRRTIPGHLLQLNSIVYVNTFLCTYVLISDFVNSSEHSLLSLTVNLSAMRHYSCFVINLFIHVCHYLCCCLSSSHHGFQHVHISVLPVLHGLLLLQQGRHQFHLCFHPIYHVLHQVHLGLETKQVTTNSTSSQRINFYRRFAVI
jgi:hypothetical protein